MFEFYVELVASASAYENEQEIVHLLSCLFVKTWGKQRKSLYQKLDSYKIKQQTRKTWLKTGWYWERWFREAESNIPVDIGIGDNIKIGHYHDWILLRILNFQKYDIIGPILRLNGVCWVLVVVFEKKIRWGHLKLLGLHSNMTWKCTKYISIRKEKN